MWSYYGNKSKIVDLYPRPLHDKIIEPFAGSARYALKWFDRDVLLIDKYPVIVRLWKFLQQCQPADIMRLPEPTYKQSINDFGVSDDEKLLMGFIIGQGAASPQWIVQKFVGEPGEIYREKKKIADQLFKIRHWRIELGDYTDAPNEPATWFIDPPYQFGGEHYRMSNRAIDYRALAAWCRSRQGQAIVCENTKADWLPFFTLRRMTGAYSTTYEAIWSNYPTDFDVRQPDLFAGLL